MSVSTICHIETYTNTHIEHYEIFNLSWFVVGRIFHWGQLMEWFSLSVSWMPYNNTCSVPTVSMIYRDSHQRSFKRWMIFFLLLFLHFFPVSYKGGCSRCCIYFAFASVSRLDGELLFFSPPFEYIWDTFKCKGEAKGNDRPFIFRDDDCERARGYRVVRNILLKSFTLLRELRRWKKHFTRPSLIPTGRIIRNWILSHDEFNDVVVFLLKNVLRPPCIRYELENTHHVWGRFQFSWKLAHWSRSTLRETFSSSYQRLDRRL